MESAMQQSYYFLKNLLFIILRTILCCTLILSSNCVSSFIGQTLVGVQYLEINYENTKFGFKIVDGI